VGVTVAQLVAAGSAVVPLLHVFPHVVSCRLDRSCLTYCFVPWDAALSVVRVSVLDSFYGDGFTKIHRGSRRAQSLTQAAIRVSERHPSDGAQPVPRT
jgi:hypothetical protein